jgi:hypothetical protein
MNGGWILSFSPFKEKINKKIIKKNGWKREIDTNSEEENERQMGEEEDPKPIYVCDSERWFDHLTQLLPFPLFYILL